MSVDQLPLRALLREAYDTNNRSWTAPGALAVGVHGFRRWADRQPPQVRPLLRLLGKLGFVFVRNVYGIELPHTVQLGRRFRIAHQGGIVVHPHAVIGDDCTIRQGVTIGATRSVGFEADHPTIGDRVAIGAGAAVVGRVRVGDDVRIGPNAVVMTNIPAGSMVVSPASRIITPRAAAVEHPVEQVTR